MVNCQPMQRRDEIVSTKYNGFQGSGCWRHRSASALVLLGLLFSCGEWLGDAGNSVALAEWTGAATPHDGQHLMLVRPIELKPERGTAAAPTQQSGATFGEVVGIDQPLAAEVRVRHAGRYVVWARIVGQSEGFVPVSYSLSKGGSPVVSGELSSPRESLSEGGPQGFAEHSRIVQKSLPGNRGDGLDRNTPAEADILADIDALEQEVFLPQGVGQSVAGRRAKWVDLLRVERIDQKRPAYWWKLGEAALAPGAYTLAFRPDKPLGKTPPPQFDAAFLSTTDEIDYPFIGDINAAASSYIRFRIDAMPPGGLGVGAVLRVHADPWMSASVHLNPDGMHLSKAVPHIQPGLTRWYRLQDIERVPPFGGSEAQLLLSIGSEKQFAASRGATQLAVYPHDDYVLRELNWSEPESRRLSMAMDFQKHPHLLRTFRDRARENYERAVAATGGHAFPLTRGELCFSNGWGTADGEAGRYEVKVLRLLGFNVVDNALDPILNRRLYGWQSSGGQTWGGTPLPYDEARAKEFAQREYADVFRKQRNFYEGVRMFQIADEPGEERGGMSAPLWRFVENASGLSYVDPAGGSILATGDCDFHDCVLEGVVEQHGSWIGFRVCCNDSLAPTQYLEWRFGQVSSSRQQNMAVAPVGIKGLNQSYLERAGAVIGRGPTPFKIIYEKSAAAIFVHNKLIQTLQNLPEKGGFSIVGPQKAIRQIALRTIRDDEHIAAGSRPEISLNGSAAGDVLDAEIEDVLGDASVPAWAQPKPFRKAIEENWVISGGLPEAQEGFRGWLREQGVKPEELGCKTWKEVRMLTLPELVATPTDARRFYWSRRYSGWLTPRMFGLAADAIASHAVNPLMRGFVALSGHSLYFPSAMPLDMFELAGNTPNLIPGISDWMTSGSWRWDSHQAVAFSVAPFNAGARRPGRSPLTFPMMHCVYPSDFRSYTMLANQVRSVSYWAYGPSYAVTEGSWSDFPACYSAVHVTNNRAALVDDLLSSGTMRRSRVAMLYARSTEYWNPQSSFADKRATFLALSHEYYQPELVTEEQVADGCLADYDALVLLEPWVADKAADRIATWVNGGGLLWACADAGRFNEYNEPRDRLAELAGIQRGFQPAAAPQANTAIRVSQVEGQTEFRSHSVATLGMPGTIRADKARVLGRYDDGRSAWLEQPVGKGTVVYIGHRVGLTYTSKAARRSGQEVVWADTGRSLVTGPLKAAGIVREMTVSEPIVMASPLSSEGGTVIVLYPMRGRPLEAVQISLREPQRPLSVEWFEGDRLVPLEFSHADGLLTVSLSKLAGSQMVVIRRRPAPPDDRLSQMKALSAAHVVENLPQAKSAAALLIGGHPEWEMDDRLAPLLRDADWDVRRTAVEAIGRLRHHPSADAVAACMAAERDPHVVGDCLVTLARLADSRAPAECRTHLADGHPLVRRQSIQAAVEYFHACGDGLSLPEFARKLLLEIAAASHDQSDARMRHEGIALLGLLDPEAVLRGLQASSDPVHPAARDRAAWAIAVAASDKAFAGFQRLCPTIADGSLLAVAARRRDPIVAAEIVRRLDALLASHPAEIVGVLLCQAHPALAKAILARHGTLPPAVDHVLPIVLEKTFDARLGGVIDDWKKWSDLSTK